MKTESIYKGTSVHGSLDARATCIAIGCVPNNYCPLSLTSVVCKVLETIINLNNLFTAYQDDFRPGYSCVTQLTNVIEDH